MNMTGTHKIEQHYRLSIHFKEFVFSDDRQL